MGREQYRRKRRGTSLMPWEFEDTPSHHDQLRLLGGEVWFLEGYLAMGSFKDVLGGHGNVDPLLAVDDAKFREEFPVLFMLMSSKIDDDQKPRLTCTMTIVCEDGVVKCGINERNLSLSLWTSSESLGGCFCALEEALGERPVPWRRSNWKGRK